MRLDLNEQLSGVSLVCIAGHIRPDGDCVGSCMGLYHYLKDVFGITADVYLEPFSESMGFMEDIGCVKESGGSESPYDVFFALDCSDRERIGAGKEYLAQAGKVICIDHHISNTGYADINYILPHASSTGEVLYGLFDPDRVEKACAECLYTAIVHDTGVFQYSNVTQETMQIAGRLIAFGIDFPSIITNTFYEKTFQQNRILGRALLLSEQALNGTFVYSVLPLSELRAYGVSPIDLEGIVEMLRNTKNAECAALLYETEPDVYKLSLRSKKYIDVSKVAAVYGGGGHIRAAGAALHGKKETLLKELVRQIEKALR